MENEINEVQKINRMTNDLGNIKDFDKNCNPFATFYCY